MHGLQKKFRQFSTTDEAVKIEIEKKSGFCFGVVNAISKAESHIDQGEELYCLGEIVHNTVEVERLTEKGLLTTSKDRLASLKGKSVLFRAHGEPPSTYELADKHSIKIVDATCPVVLQLQKRVRAGYKRMKAKGGTLLILGKVGHPEVIGLLGHTDGNAVVIQNIDDLETVDFTKPIEMFCQTTIPLNGFQKMSDYLRANVPSENLKINDTVCRQVANRIPQMEIFAQQHDVVLFVSGRQSSNGKALFNVCKKINNNTHFISSVDELELYMIQDAASIGINGATSTPKWLLREVKLYAEKLLNSNALK